MKKIPFLPNVKITFDFLKPWNCSNIRSPSTIFANDGLEPLEQKEKEKSNPQEG
jgi:hypothetical protein